MKPVAPNSPLTDAPYTPERPRLTQNAVYWPAADVYLKSTHVHDFVGHFAVIMGMPQELAIDGGLEYRRTTFSGNPVYEDFCLWSDSPFEDICRKILWGTHGKDGKQPLTYRPIATLELDHLRAIKSTQPHIKGTLIEKVVDFWIIEKQ